MGRAYPGGVNAETPGTGDRLVRAGGILFLLGAVGTLVTVAPLFLGTDPFPAAAYWVCMLMGAGFALAAAGLLHSAREGRRQARSSLAGSPTGPESREP
ncbi:hypothetical protein [Streptomyces sp. NPDC005438]|uniref:hypothetical protein n=1 Tax=Streptomyces sp. NPDC005438 TaxID=3156880 RepID=UPI0033B49C8B